MQERACQYAQNKLTDKLILFSILRRSLINQIIPNQSEGIESLLIGHWTVFTLTHAMRDRGKVRMIRMAEIPVSMMAQGPGPVGSAEYEKKKHNYFLSDILSSPGASSGFLHRESIDLCWFTSITVHCYQSMVEMERKLLMFCLKQLQKLPRTHIANSESN